MQVQLSSGDVETLIMLMAMIETVRELLLARSAATVEYDDKLEEASRLLHRMCTEAMMDSPVVKAALAGFVVSPRKS